MDKPKGLTSHDVVARVRRIAKTKRIGHTGTLDPMATGVLVLCLGKATRLIPYIEEAGGPDAKEYEALIRFGFETITDDAEGEQRGDTSDVSTLNAAEIEKALRSFVGQLSQIPPAFSAKKVEGERAYDLARRGEEVVLAAVAIDVGSAELLGFEEGVARVRFRCSRGTYVRALARDLGRSLNVGAHLVGLRRTRSGTKGLETAVRLDDLTPDLVRGHLMPLAAILDTWPMATVTPEQTRDLRLGRAIRVPVLRLESGRFRLCDSSGELIALAQSETGSLKPFCVF